jgi:large subunit ribosomal protein L3
MLGFIIGKKSTQSQMFDGEGKRIPVTTIKTSPCYVVDIIHRKDGKEFALILGFDTAKRVNKPTKGFLTKAGIEAPIRNFREFNLAGRSDVEFIENEGKKAIKVGEMTISIGDIVKPSEIFKEGDIIDVAGTTKGKGFQGVVKRHGFRGGPRTHGQSDRERAPGSLGQRTTPGRVYKGKRMAGRMGGERKTVKNLSVIRLSEEEIVVKGLVPGARNGLLEVSLRTL